MWAIGKITKSVEKEDYILKMEITMKAILKMICLMEKGNIIKNVEQY